MRRANGQGTIEYIAVVALVAALLVAGGAALAGPGLANAVGRAMARALCSVTGRVCPTLEPQACTVRSARTSGKLGVKVVVISVGRELAILRAEKSDGTISLTLLDHRELGLETTLGAKGRLELGDAAVGTGATAEAALVARFGGGRTWVVSSKAAADELERRLREVAAGRAAGGGILGVPNPVDLASRVLHRGAHRHLPAPDRTVTSGAVQGKAEVSAGPLHGLHGALGVELGRMRSRDGSTTWLGAVEAQLGVPLLEQLGVRPQAGARVEIGVSTGPDGRPRTFSVSGAGTLSGPLAVPVPVGGGSGRLATSAARRVSVSATLDLQDGVNLTAVQELLAGLRAADLGRVRRAVGTVAGLLRDDAAVDVAAYREQARSYGGGAQVGAGVQAGISASLSSGRSELAGAWSRPPGGAWETRVDCVA